MTTTTIERPADTDQTPAVGNRRGDCATCGREARLDLDGFVFAHRQMRVKGFADKAKTRPFKYASKDTCSGGHERPEVTS